MVDFTNLPSVIPFPHFTPVHNLYSSFCSNMSYQDKVLIDDVIRKVDESVDTIKKYLLSLREQPHLTNDNLSQLITISKIFDVSKDVISWKQSVIPFADVPASVVVSSDSALTGHLALLSQLKLNMESAVSCMKEFAGHL